MKKTIFISVATLIISGCGREYSEHNFVQSSIQPRQQINIPTRDYGSKSVEEIKRDLALTQTKKQITSKTLSVNTQSPQSVKTFASKSIVKKGFPVVDKPQSTKSIPKINSPTEKTPFIAKEINLTKKSSKSVLEIKQALKEDNQPPGQKENLLALPAPQVKTIIPPITAIKDFIQEQPKVDKEKMSDKTVVIVQPSSKDGKPKAALKITNARNKIIASGKKLIGTPYLFGGSNRSGFDCSGLVQYVYKQHGINVPRTSRNQFSALKSVKNPQPGDLVFFRHGNHPVNHVGIYIGDNKMLHAPSTGKTVKIVDITTKYWKKRYAGARRVLDSNYLVK